MFTCSLVLFLISSAILLSASEPKLSLLEYPPDWSKLDIYQKSITRTQFKKRIRAIYSPDQAFFKYLKITDESVTVYRERTKKTPLWTLTFAPSEKAAQANHPSKNKDSIDYTRPITHVPNSKLNELIAQKPLSGIKICLDPGHIGGEWAKMEERSFDIRNKGSVEEAALNFKVCKLLAPLLEKAGAEIVWTKTTLEPVTQLRPDDLKEEAKKVILQRNPSAAGYLNNPRLQMEIEEQSWFLFYRVAEIHARADIINKTLKPDITLCIHHNASPWLIPKVPNLTDKNKLVIFTHGAYMASELEYDDQKYALMRKLLENRSREEIALAESVAHQMGKVWGWPPENYEDKLNVWPASNSSPYVWHRNLMASRLFQGPVVFIEGPYMNNELIYKRLLAGDYDGTKKIGGKSYRSIYREFAEIVAHGVIESFASWRVQKPTF